MRINRAATWMLAFLVPFSVQAMIYRVPEDLVQIQQAIDAASTADTVLVSPGIYYENLTFRAKALTLGSLTLTTGDTTYISQTIIDGSTFTNPDSASVIYIGPYQDTLSQVVGFTITGGKGMRTADYPLSVIGGGIVVHWSRASVRDCHIAGNGPVYEMGGFILLGGFARIENTRFESNSAGYGTAFGCNTGTIECVNCNICRHDGGMATCLVDSSEFIIRDCQFHDNTIYSGFDVFASYGSFVCNKVFENVSSEVNARAAIFGGEARIDSNEFWNNEGLCCVWVYNMDACSIRWNYFHDNVNMEATSVLSIYSEQFPTYRYIYGFQNIFSYNQGRLGAIYNSGRLKLVENYFEGNKATSAYPDFGGVISSGGWSLIMRHNDIEYNDSLAVGSEYDMRGVDAIENYWGDSTGPYHPVLNPMGLGNAVGDCVRFIPWLREPAASVGKTRPQIPQSFTLLAPYPNPFNPGVTLPLEVRRPGSYRIEIFDLLGRLVWSKREQLSAGTYKLYWPGMGLNEQAVSAGIYFARAISGTEMSPARKLVLIR